MDSETQKLAREVDLIESKKPANQASGFNFNKKNWEKRIRHKKDVFDKNITISSPETIINCFQNREYLQGVALVVLWGMMWRQSKSIYGKRSLDDIHRAIKSCSISIQRSKKINRSWIILTEDIGWSAVIASKTLHFLCRSLGFNSNPPVPVDNAIVRKKIWPDFVETLPRVNRPKNWQGNSLNAYLRYMSAINIWAKKRKWTTTQIEVTLFDDYQNDE